MLARLHHFHQFAEGVEAAGKAAVGVKLHQDFLRLADSEAGIQPLIQGSIEAGHIARRHGGGNERDGLLLGR
ncbi:hypothetical protein D3C78_1716220 [compost metagenome]